MLSCSFCRVRALCPESDRSSQPAGRSGGAAGRTALQGFWAVLSPRAAVLVSCVRSCVNPVHGGHSHVIGLSRH